MDGVALLPDTKDSIHAHVYQNEIYFLRPMVRDFAGLMKEIHFPSELKAFRDLDRETRRNFLEKNKDFFKDGVVFEYLSAFSAAEAVNNSNLYWLLHDLKNCAMSESEKLEVRKKIAEIRVGMEQYKMRISGDIEIAFPKWRTEISVYENTPEEWIR